MLWIEYVSKDSVALQSLSESVKLQHDFLAMVGERIFPSVGLIDARLNSVLIYDAAMKGSNECSLPGTSI
jgi:hypothetical protein